MNDRSCIGGRNHGPIEVIYGFIRPKVRWCLTCGALKHEGGEWELPLTMIRDTKAQRLQ